MGRFDDEAAAAARQADELLDDQLTRLGAGREDLRGLLPSPSDQQAYDALVQEVQRSTGRSLRLQAWAKFAGAASETAVKLVRKALFPA